MSFLTSLNKFIPIIIELAIINIEYMYIYRERKSTLQLLKMYFALFKILLIT